jgi:hypothetical protein
MEPSYYVLPEFRDRIRNQNPQQLRNRTPILARQPLQTVPQLGLDPDRYRTKLGAHERLH